MICRLCGSENLKLWYTQGNHNEFNFYRCQTCRLVNYDVSSGVDQGKYADVYVDPHDPLAPQNKGQSLTAQFITSHLKSRGKALEIGCGNGRVLLLLRNAGWNVRGLELSDFLATAVQETLGIKVHTANFLQYHQREKGGYNLVVLRHVLEHLTDCVSTLTSINTLLAPGGHAVMEFPNIDALGLRWKRLLRKTGIYRKRYPRKYVPGHVNEFSRKPFEILTKMTGFEVLLWETYSLKPFHNFIYNRLPIGNKARTIIRKVADSNVTENGD
jgi:2-polyprenyl-3-methyl-5-hydroxy-6-metoxy-1,4-benzoquinol methylase